MTEGYYWRVWLAFEVKPGITRTHVSHWRALTEACRGADGMVDRAEREYWAAFLIDNVHMWGEA